MKYAKIKMYFFQQKTRLLGELFDGSHANAVTASLRIFILTYSKQLVKQNCVEVRGVEPPRSGFVDWPPHRRTPTAIPLFQIFTEDVKDKAFEK